MANEPIGLNDDELAAMRSDSLAASGIAKLIGGFPDEAAFNAAFRRMRQAELRCPRRLVRALGEIDRLIAEVERLRKVPGEIVAAIEAEAGACDMPAGGGIEERRRAATQAVKMSALVQAADIARKAAGLNPPSPV